MEKKSISKNYIYNLAYQVLLIFLPLITTPYVSRVLGAENIGIYGYTLSIVTYFVLFGALGISMYAQREIAYVQNDIQKRSKIFWEIVIFRFITMTISIIIYYIFFIKSSKYQLYYLIFTIELISTCFDISWFFQGLEEFKKTVLRNIVVKLVSFACILLFVKTENDLAIYILIYVLSNIIGNLSLWLYLPKYIQKIKLNSLEILRHLKPTLWLFIPQIAMQIYTVMDKTMIGNIIVDKSEVGYYEQAQKIIKLCITIVTSLGIVMVPRMANTFANGDKEKLKEYMCNSFRFVYFLAFPIMIGLICISSKFVPIFFGEGYERVSILIRIISPIILFIGISNIIGTQYLLPTKKQKSFTISVTAGAIINFILNIFLIRNIGAIGASIATVIAEGVVTIFQGYSIRKEFKIKEFIMLGKNSLISSIGMIIPVVLIDYFIKQPMLSLISQVSVGFIVYIGFLYILKDEIIVSILKKIKKGV